MLCSLAVRRSLDVDEEALPYRLRILSKHAIEGTVQVLSDEARYPTLPALVQALRELRLPDDLLGEASATSELEHAEDRRLPLGDLQIPIEALATADFHLAVTLEI